MSKTSDTKSDEPVNTSEVPSKKSPRNLWKLAGGIVGCAVAILAILASYIYTATPAVIRKPSFQHYHFRMQILVNGKAENFAEQKYQTGYSKDNCNADLTAQPIHFHDNKDQMVHIHWDGMTGGLVLKYYGWNYVGGIKGSLGYRFDKLSDVQKVPIHGNVLPAVPDGDTFYVFTGDDKSYQEHTFDEFLHKDLESFFGKKSNLPGDEAQTSLLDRLFPKAYAHGTENHETTTTSESETEGAKLARINNLIGSVIIFVQKDKPTDQQIKDRFNMLEPLSDSTCGG